MESRKKCPQRISESQKERTVVVAAVVTVVTVVAVDVAVVAVIAVVVAVVKPSQAHLDPALHVSCYLC